MIPLFLTLFQGGEVFSQNQIPSNHKPNTMIEIRSYNLKHGTRSQFNKLVMEEGLPMLKRWNIDVVAYGPSQHDEDSYFLARSFQNVEERQKAEDAFYGSKEWKNGPRDAVLSLIENYTTIVVPLQTFCPQAKSEDDRKQLSALNALFIKNFITNDTVSHNKIIHKDFVYISIAGKIVNRHEYMNAWARGYNQEIDKSFEYRDEFIRIFGNMALVRANTFYTFLENGKLVEGKTVYTDTYIKENGRWWCVQAQITECK